MHDLLLVELFDIEYWIWTWNVG